MDAMLVRDRAFIVRRVWRARCATGLDSVGVAPRSSLCLSSVPALLEMLSSVTRLRYSAPALGRHLLGGTSWGTSWGGAPPKRAKAPKSQSLSAANRPDKPCQRGLVDFRDVTADEHNDPRIPGV